MTDGYLEQLNPSQRAAVEFCDGPSLVIAGAGSGKTRVLTSKVAYLLSHGYRPWRIMALTFTNKAAREMKERVDKIVGEGLSRDLWMGTFHSVFARILRREAELLGYPRDFTIYDAADSKSLIKSIIKEMNLDDKQYRPGLVQSRISNAKNALVTPGMYGGNREVMQYDLDSGVPLIRDIYATYMSRAKRAGAMDFDDLLLMTNVLFRDHPEVLAKYQQMYDYVLVDEYQDTNFAQHMIVKRLVEPHNHICVVGDDAQSIYSFRGANIDNILQFKNTFQDTHIFKLEQNYRSTQNIVNAANSLIDKNQNKIDKTVFSQKEVGSKVRLISTYSDQDEAQTVANLITEQRMKNPDYTYADFAILYRTNSQSRVLESALRERNIPYRVYGGLSFYQRKEIKDIVSYFRVITNPHDEEAMKRIINYPLRGIGATTVGKLVDLATQENASLWTVLNQPDRLGALFNKGTAAKLERFREMISGFVGKNRDVPAEELAEQVIRDSGISDDVFNDPSIEGMSKQENLKELLKSVEEFAQMRREEGLEMPTLTDYLQEIALLTDQDNDAGDQNNRATLMTVHAAKGLEFPNVFVVGMEEGLFPSSMSTGTARELEEERRLFYVAITRAMDNCWLLYARKRFHNGSFQDGNPSRFLRDISREYLDTSRDFYSELSQVVNEPQPPRPEPAQKSTPFYQPSRPRKLTPTTSLNTKKGDASMATDPDTLRIGTRVQHDRFGIGVVTDLDMKGKDTRATVEFDSVGEKNLVLRFAKLTVIE